MAPCLTVKSMCSFSQSVKIFIFFLFVFFACCKRPTLVVLIKLFCICVVNVVSFDVCRDTSAKAGGLAVVYGTKHVSVHIIESTTVGRSMFVVVVVFLFFGHESSRLSN